MKLYKELAEWWPLLSPHTEYEEEAHLFLKIIQQYHPQVKEALEFGSGGGSNAFYLKKHFSMTLTDLSADMLEVSRKLNPIVRICREICGRLQWSASLIWCSSMMQSPILRRKLICWQS